MDWDIYHGRLNPSANNTITSTLFEVHNLKSRHSVVPDFDVFGWCSHSTMVRRVRHAHITPRGYVHTHSATRQPLRNKAEFKEFMRTIGLEEYIPKTYTVDNATYPCILKLPSKGEFGKGVHVVSSRAEVEKIIKDRVHSGDTFYLEEGLNGSPTDEAIALGSVFNGTLVGMRCGVHAHSLNDLSEITNFNQTSLYVRGINMTKSRFYLTPCSKELVGVITKMFTKLGSYTGAFCADMKTDSDLNIKIMEVNPRNCHTHAYDDGIFLSSFVPLSFAIWDSLRNLTSNIYVNASTGSSRSTSTDDRAWYRYGGIFRNILEVERRVLETGGGPGFWNGVERWNQSKIIFEYGYREDLGIPKMVPKPFHD